MNETTTPYVARLSADALGIARLALAEFHAESPEGEAARAEAYRLLGRAYEAEAFASLAADLSAIPTAPAAYDFA